MGLTRWMKHGNLHPTFMLPNDNVAANTIGGDKLVTNTVDGTKIVANTVTNDKLVEGILRCVDTVFTAAQVCNMHTTALAIAPAPGANKAILPMEVLCSYRYGSAAFGNVANTDVLELSGSSTPANTYGEQSNAVGFLDQTANKFTVIRSPTVANVAANTALFLGLAGAVDTGTGGTLAVRCCYKIVPTNL